MRTRKTPNNAFKRRRAKRARLNASVSRKKMMDTVAIRTTVGALAVSGLGYIVFPPFYETGIWKFLVPLLGAFDLWIALAIVKRSVWVRRWLRPFAIGTLIVAVPFWGQSG